MVPDAKDNRPGLPLDVQFSTRTRRRLGEMESFLDRWASLAQRPLSGDPAVGVFLKWLIIAETLSTSKKNPDKAALDQHFWHVQMLQKRSIAVRGLTLGRVARSLGISLRTLHRKKRELSQFGQVLELPDQVSAKRL